jgi:hypothetical protein
MGNILRSTILGLAVAGAAAISQACAASTYQRIPGPCAMEEGAILYQQTFSKDGISTSRAQLFFERTSFDSAFCYFLLTGELRNISASILFPEDVTIIHSQVIYCYEANSGWYKKREKEPSQFVKVLKEEVAPASLPGHLLPFGFDSGYRFTRKVLKRTIEKPILDDCLENEFDSVAIVFQERRKVQKFLIRVPLEELEPSKEYLMKVIAQYDDGETRIIDDSFYLKLD